MEPQQCFDEEANKAHDENGGGAKKIEKNDVLMVSFFCCLLRFLGE